MERVEYRKLVREAFGLKHLTDQHIDEMFDRAQAAIEDYKLKHPTEWAQAEEQERERLARKMMESD